MALGEIYVYLVYLFTDKDAHSSMTLMIPPLLPTAEFLTPPYMFALCTLLVSFL